MKEFTKVEIFRLRGTEKLSAVEKPCKKNEIGPMQITVQFRRWMSRTIH